ncbi:MAG: tol-pal system protein YbgF [Burkholderiales bacterium]|jgi:tol-pal system protein YbgF|nr:tol-pal system protein YbgF [Nitrosomonadaceae bacterium]
MHKTFSLQLSVAILMLAICIAPRASAGLFDDDEARKRIAQLAEKVEAQNKANDERFQKLDESIRSLGIIQLLNQIEALNTEINRLRGQIEVLTNQNEQLQKRQRDFYLDIDTRLRALEAGSAPTSTAATINPPLVSPSATPSATPVAASGAASGAAPPAAPAAATAPAATVASPNAAAAEAAARERENKAYDVGSAAFRRGDWAGAVRAYTTFAADYAQSQLVPNAIYWISLSQFNLKTYPEARATAEGLIKRFPDSGKVPDAMLVIASVQAEMGDAGSARNTFEDIIAKHPTSDAAAKARTRLAGVRASR